MTLLYLSSASGMNPQQEIFVLQRTQFHQTESNHKLSQLGKIILIGKQKVIIKMRLKMLNKFIKTSHGEKATAFNNSASSRRRVKIVKVKKHVG